MDSNAAETEFIRTHMQEAVVRCCRSLFGFCGQSVIGLSFSMVLLLIIPMLVLAQDQSAPTDQPDPSVDPATPGHPTVTLSVSVRRALVDPRHP